MEPPAMSTPVSSLNVFTFCLVDSSAATPRHIVRRPTLYAWMTHADKASALEAHATRLDLLGLVLAVRASLDGVSEVPLATMAQRPACNPEVAEALRAFLAARTLEGARVAAPSFQHWDALEKSVKRLKASGAWLQSFESAMEQAECFREEAEALRVKADADKLSERAATATRELAAHRRLTTRLH